MSGLSVGETRQRVCTWRLGFETARWTTLSKWLAAIEAGRLFRVVRPSPAGASLRRKAERAAATLCSLAQWSSGLEAQAFEGAALAA
jgi:hypothetical protein